MGETPDTGQIVEMLTRGITAIFNDGTPSQVGPDEEDLRRTILLIKELEQGNKDLRKILKRNADYIAELHSAISARSMPELVTLKRDGLQSRKSSSRNREWHVLK